MTSQLMVERTYFKIRLSCRSCGKEAVFYASDLDSEIPCDNDKCLELQPFARENIEEIEFYLASQSPHYKTTATVLVDHEKKELIPGDTGAFYGNQYIPYSQVRREVIDLLRIKGDELTKEHFWKGYTFVEDFSRITTI
jgi:hypothetical protein